MFQNCAFLKQIESHHYLINKYEKSDFFKINLLNHKDINNNFIKELDY